MGGHVTRELYTRGGSSRVNRDGRQSIGSKVAAAVSCVFGVCRTLSLPSTVLPVEEQYLNNPDWVTYMYSHKLGHAEFLGIGTANPDNTDIIKA